MTLIGITAGQRRIVLRWAICLCTGSAVLLPLAARSGPAVSSTAALPEPIGLPAIVADGPRVGPLAIRRDPFERTDARPNAGAPDGNASIGTPGSIGTRVTQGSQIAGAPPLAEPGVPDLAVLAIISGKRQLALIMDRGENRVVGIGDSVSNARIAAMSGAGITLSDGRVLRLESGTP